MCVSSCFGVFSQLSAFLPNNKQQPQTVRCIYNSHHKLQKIRLWHAINHDTGENTVKQVVLSPEVQQALGKLNVRLADLMEQTNAVIKVLVDENMELRAKLDSIQAQQQKDGVKRQ